MDLSDEEVEKLRESCAHIASDNWDGGCTVERGPGPGELAVTMLSEDGEPYARALLKHEGEWGNARVRLQMFSLQLEGETDKAYVTLVPAVIVGYMSL